MAGPENQVPTRIRASIKRPNQSAETNPTMKKRVALGEITNTSSNSNLGVGEARKLKHEPVLKKNENDAKAALVVSPGSDQSRKSEYARVLVQHLQSLEVEPKRRPLSNYMEKIQADITPVMRAILVDWLVEVAEEYKIVSDTLFLTLNYIDIYLSAHKLPRNKLQLLGVSCMLVASKYEEISPPRVEHFCYITDNTYTKEEVWGMEREILKLLDFEMGIPTTKTFLRNFSRAAQDKPEFANLQFEYFSWLLSELSLVDYGCLRYLPSKIAASAVYLTRLTILPESHPWSMALQEHTGYKPDELKDCVLRLQALLLGSETSARAIHQKYMNQKFKRVASMCPPVDIREFYFKVSDV